MSPAGSIVAVESWIDASDSADFPYLAVVDDFLEVGKHFVDGRLLKTLDEARTRTLPGTQVRAFLDIALDKYDGMYDYLSYTALSLLRNPADRPPEQALAVRDRQLTGLLHDLLRFELSSLGSDDTPLPSGRPTEATVAKRSRHALRALIPALERLGYSMPPERGTAIAGATQVCALVGPTLGPDELLTLRLSMLPVYTVHDEYMFLRVLQSFETTFALLAANMREVIDLLGGAAPDIRSVCVRLSGSATLMHESAPLFSLLATMQVDSFHAFRTYTDGASAIQSESYKTVESLCRSPTRDRLDSLAYTSVPRIRDAVLREQGPTVWESYQRIRARLRSEEAEAVDTAVAELQSAHRRWRTTHYRLAVRMLGDAGGTGATEGTPYLRSVLDNELLTPGSAPPPSGPSVRAAPHAGPVQAC